MDLDEHGQPQRASRAMQSRQRRVVERADDEQHGVGAGQARLEQLVFVDDEILAQHRHVDGRADGGEVSQRAVEERRLGQHRNGYRAARRVGLGSRDRVVVLGQDPAGRRPPFALRDHVDGARPRHGLGESGAPRDWTGHGLSFERLEGQPRPSDLEIARACRRRSPRAGQARRWSRRGSGRGHETVERRGRMAAVDRRRRARQALAERRGSSGHEERGPRIQQDDVTRRPVLAAEHSMDDGGVADGIAAA